MSDNTRHAILPVDGCDRDFGRIHAFTDEIAGKSRKDRRWWSQTGSNRRPPACKAGALPTELWPRVSEQQNLGTQQSGNWWAWEDLNFRPHAYQARALTN